MREGLLVGKDLLSLGIERLAQRDIASDLRSTHDLTCTVSDGGHG
jgi:hypothetical protein